MKQKRRALIWEASEEYEEIDEAGENIYCGKLLLLKISQTKMPNNSSYGRINIMQLWGAN